MMILYPHIFASLSNKAPAVDHYFFKNTQLSFFLLEVVCGQVGISGLCKVVRKFVGLGMQGHSNGSSVRNVFEVSFTEEATVARKYFF